MAARELNANGYCDGCGANFQACVGLYHCKYGCEQPPEPEFCCDCGTDITGTNMPQCDACSEKEAAKALRIGGLVTMLYRAGRRA